MIGRDWEQFIDSSYVAMQNIPNSELSQEYKSAHFVFNDHWDTMKEYGFISNRIFDVLACGGRLITDFVEGIDEIVPNNAIFAYQNIDEIKDYLSSPDLWPTEQDLIHASSIIIEKHTFLARAHTILMNIYSATKYS